jgi:hypothetical protein
VFPCEFFLLYCSFSFFSIDSCYFSFLYDLVFVHSFFSCSFFPYVFFVHILYCILSLFFRMFFHGCGVYLWFELFQLFFSSVLFDEWSFVVLV